MPGFDLSSFDSLASTLLSLGWVVRHLSRRERIDVVDCGECGQPGIHGIALSHVSLLLLITGAFLWVGTSHSAGVAEAWEAAAYLGKVRLAHASSHFLSEAVLVAVL